MFCTRIICGFYTGIVYGVFKIWTSYIVCFDDVFCMPCTRFNPRWITGLRPLLNQDILRRLADLYLPKRLSCISYMYGKWGSHRNNSEHIFHPQKILSDIIIFSLDFNKIMLIHISILWPSDAVWYKLGPTLAYGTVCFPTALSFYLNQCWLNNSAVLSHSPNNNGN